MIKRIIAGILRSKKDVYPKHVHMTKDGILYTSPKELLEAETVKQQIRKMDSLHYRKSNDLSQDSFPD